MILVGNQRGGAKDLALHLLKDENDRVEVHEIRGFIADDLPGALQESYAVSRGTRCKQHLYSLSLNPPPEETVDKAVFADAIDRIEKKLGLTDQPRAVVFHEKNGRRHAHAVWCRINADEMKAVPLAYDRTKLQEVAREIYIERDWRMPRGFIDQAYTDPRNFTLAEWQQAKRAEKDPKQLKTLFQDAWALSDSRASFSHALKERGFVLAKGDRRGFVAVDHTGEAYAVARWVGLKTKQVKERFGPPDDLPSIAEAHKQAAQTITMRLDELKAEQQAAAKAEQQKLEQEKKHALSEQRQKADALKAAHARRSQQEQKERDAKIRKGLLGFWDRLTGRRKKIEAENTAAAALALKRDHTEKARLAADQEAQRKALQNQITASRMAHRAVVESLAADQSALRDGLKQTAEAQQKERQRTRTSERKPRRCRSRDGRSRSP